MPELVAIKRERVLEECGDSVSDRGTCDESVVHV